ncbi:MAG: iron ABC transporter permease [Clostridia bacterium]|nr:iron ABC transporter permease [Clostridia bacterium]MBQ9289826.1 iron ABC transporter permease [Clostridia bacterium]MBR0216437.1 iron ABC transporter permease [Clostridia bacterium]
MQAIKVPLKTRLARMTPGQMIMFGILAAIFIWFIMACMILPILNLLKTVFFEGGKLSVDAFQKLLKSPRAMKALRNSFILAPTLSITVGFVGISLVLITEYFDIKGSKILRLGYLTTLIYGGVTLVSGYKFIYSNTGVLTNLMASIFPNMNRNWFTGYWAVLFVMTFSCTSNHMIFLRNAMRSVDFQTVEAARNMGASQWYILRRVVLPVLLPSLFAVTILTFITGLCAMSAPLLVGGKDFQTINPMIKQFADMTTTSAKSLSATLSLVLGLATMILLAILTAIERRGHYMSVSKVKTKIVKQKITNPVVNVLVHIYAYVLFVIYVIPVVLIVLFSFSDSAHIQMRQLDFSTFSLQNYVQLLSQNTAYRPFVVSIVYSALASIIVGALVIVACRYIQKRRNSVSATALEYSLMLPWLLPSTMIALSLMLAFNQPRWYMFNQPLIATLQLLLIGYIIVKLPFTMRMTKAAFFGLDDALEDASRNLGASGLYTFRRVIFPVLLPTVLAIAALNFNGLLTDYDISAFLHHPANPTLGVKIKSLTEEMGNSSDGVALTFVYAVLMMIISAVVLYLVYGRGSRDDLKG